MSDSELKNPIFGEVLVASLGFLHIIAFVTKGSSKTELYGCIIIVRLTEHLPQKSILTLQ